VIGCRCEVCHSPDPRDRRTRHAALLEEGGRRLLIDTPPELRLQLVGAGIDMVDAVAYTHLHADHTHGIDDLRAITVRRHTALPIYGPAETLDNLREKFRYVFDSAMRPLPGTSKPEGAARPLESGETFTVGDMTITPVRVPHGNVTVFAYRIGPLAYVSDAKALPAEALAVLRGATTLVINALFRTEHPTHLSIPEAVGAARAVGAERTFLTHLTHDNFHAELEAELPSGIVPAFDGLTVHIG
jgi:phosphoribosyl 1,2-cyclic phosphate phosphodiesterase